MNRRASRASACAVNASEIDERRNDNESSTPELTEPVVGAEVRSKRQRGPTRSTAPQNAGLPSVTEAELLQQVIDLAHLFGYRCAHFRPAWTGRGWRTPVQGDGAGFPDLILVGRGRVIAAELKRESAPDPTGEQAAWLEELAAAGVPVFVWRPSDLERIADVLGRERAA